MAIYIIIVGNLIWISQDYLSGLNFAAYISLKFINYRKFDNYSEGELIKLKDYDKITDMIISDIESNIDKSQDSKVAIGI